LAARRAAHIREGRDGSAPTSGPKEQKGEKTAADLYIAARKEGGGSKRGAAVNTKNYARLGILKKGEFLLVLPPS